MTDRKDIESPKVEGLIPRQLVEDSAALVEFLKEYYRFLNQEGGPSYALNALLKNRDVDTAVDEFLTLIHNEIGSGFAKEIRTLSADKNNLYKHIKEFYSCKGSLDSFQTLFKLLFNTNVEIILPKDQILIASDGRWLQQESFFIEATSGDPLDLYAQIITLVSENNYIDVEVERVRKVYPAQDYYEIFITRNVNTNRIVTGATFTFNGISGEVIDSLGNIELIYGGQNFEVPQFVEIDYQSTGTLIRISEVDASGAIIKFKVLSFGIGYTNDFYARIVPRSEISGDDLIVIDEEDIETEIDSNPTHAIIKFSNAAIAKYPGEFTNNKGFLSDDIYLQDNYYYQQYSYVIKSGIQIENYRNIVRKTVHPAGMIFFGQFEITNEFDLSQNIQSLSRYLRARLQSQFSTTDTLVVNFFKDLSSSVDVEEQDDYNINYSKILTESLSVSEETAIHFYKNTSEVISTTSEKEIDFNKALESSIIPQSVLRYSFSKSLASNITANSALSNSFAKSVTGDSITMTDSVSFELTRIYNASSIISTTSILSFNYDKGITDNISVNDNARIILQKPLNESINITETAKASFNPYTLDVVDYFAEDDYTEGNYTIA